LYLFSKTPTEAKVGWGNWTMSSCFDAITEKSKGEAFDLI
jgi:hypothetical protein